MTKDVTAILKYRSIKGAEFSVDKFSVKSYSVPYNVMMLNSKMFDTPAMSMDVKPSSSTHCQTNNHQYK